MLDPWSPRTGFLCIFVCSGWNEVLWMLYWSTCWWYSIVKCLTGLWQIKNFTRNFTGRDFFLRGFAVMELLWFELRLSMFDDLSGNMKVFVIAVCYFLYETEDSNSLCCWNVYPSLKFYRWFWLIFSSMATDWVGMWITITVAMISSGCLSVCNGWVSF